MADVPAPEASSEAARPLIKKLGFLVWGTRWIDLAIISAFPIMGALFAIPGLDFATLKRLGLFLVGTLAFTNHIFVFNDWSDAVLNPEEPERRKRQIFKGAILSKLEIFGLCLGCWLLGMAIFVALSPWLGVIALFLTGFSSLYSHPRINLKGRPALGTLAHFFVACFYFLGGWIAFSKVTPLGAGLGVYFGLVLSAGHYSNEIEDFSQDFAAGIRTNAIAFGQRVMFRVGLALFVVSSLLLVAISLLWMGGIYFPFVAFCSLYFWIYQVWRYRDWKGGDSIAAFRKTYRLAYALLCAALLSGKAAQWLSLWSDSLSGLRNPYDFYY